MEGVVRRGLFRPAAPGVERLDQRLLRVGNDEVDDAGRAAGETRRSARIEVVARDRAHEGQLHVRMRIDATGHDELSARIDDHGAGRGCDVLADLHDPAVGTKHIGTVAVGGIDDGAAADQTESWSVSGLDAAWLLPAND